jgi:hypothetical protein
LAPRNTPYDSQLTLSIIRVVAAAGHQVDVVVASRGRRMQRSVYLLIVGAQSLETGTLMQMVSRLAQPFSQLCRVSCSQGVRHHNALLHHQMYTHYRHSSAPARVWLCTAHRYSGMARFISLSVSDVTTSQVKRFVI